MIKANDLSEIISKAADAIPLTIETMMAAIEKLNERPSIFPQEHPFHGVIEIKECAWLKGTETVVLSGDKALYWPDVFDLKEYKVLKVPPIQLPSIWV